MTSKLKVTPVIKVSNLTIPRYNINSGEIFRRYRLIFRIVDSNNIVFGSSLCVVTFYGASLDIVDTLLGNQTINEVINKVSARLNNAEEDLMIINQGRVHNTFHENVTTFLDLEEFIHKSELEKIRDTTFHYPDITSSEISDGMRRLGDENSSSKQVRRIRCFSHDIEGNFDNSYNVRVYEQINDFKSCDFSKTVKLMSVDTPLLHLDSISDDDGRGQTLVSSFRHDANIPIADKLQDVAINHLKTPPEMEPNLERFIRRLSNSKSDQQSVVRQVSAMLEDDKFIEVAKRILSEIDLDKLKI